MVDGLAYQLGAPSLHPRRRPLRLCYPVPPRKAKSRLGLSYEALPGPGGKSILGSKEATLKEVRVFYCPDIAKLY